MKKSVTWLVLLCMLVALLPAATVSAAQTHEEIIRLDNGDYIVITTETVGARASGKKTVSKTHTYRDSNGDALWAGKLTASFTYTGTSATCTASSASVTIYDTSWSNDAKSATKSGNTATAVITMSFKLLGVVVSKETCTIKLTCDKNGNIT